MTLLIQWEGEARTGTLKAEQKYLLLQSLTISDLKIWSSRSFKKGEITNKYHDDIGVILQFIIYFTLQFLLCRIVLLSPL